MMQRRWVASLLFLSLLFSPAAWSSKPLVERSAEACREALSLRAGTDVAQAPSPSTLIPLNLLIASRQCDYIPKMWRWAQVYAKQFPTPGLAYMYKTAETAADQVIEELKISATSPPMYDERNPWAAADATLRLIESESPPAYIRKAVLIRDGVLVVVPILKRTEFKNSKGRALYQPIVTKGHQELERSDELAAAFAAWALEPWQGELPEYAEVFLKPMVDKRVQTPKTSGNFKLNVNDYLPRIRAIYEGFMDAAEQASLASDKEVEASRPERRCDACKTCPWAANCRVKLNEADDLSMMPFPPSAAQATRLAKLGYGTQKELSSVNVNSDDFLNLAMKADIEPEQLRYFIAHALARTTDQVLVLEKFSDPTAGKKYIIHIDFEDVMDRQLRSGVYLIGAEKEAVKRGKRPVKPIAFWASSLTQKGVDEVWVKLLRWVKNSPELKNGDFLVTMFSKHEAVKFEQQFDILKQDPEKFTKEQRASRYYSEVTVGNRRLGRLIRRQEFFRSYRDLAPEDIFGMLDRSLDLLVFARKNFAFPTYTNSIKYLREYVTDEAPDYNGMNGLESIALAVEAFRTGEPRKKKVLEEYVLKDASMNRYVLNYIRSEAGREVSPKLDYRSATLDVIEALDGAVAERRQMFFLREKQQLLHKILGKKLSDLTTKQIETLKEAIDRSKYERARTVFINDGRLSENSLKSILQRLRFDLEQKRNGKLTELFTSINPALKNRTGQMENNPAQDALASFLEAGDKFLIQKHVDDMLMIEQLEPRMAKIKLPKNRSVQSDLEPPSSVDAGFESFAQELKAQYPDFATARARSLWLGLYYEREFPDVLLEE